MRITNIKYIIVQAYFNINIIIIIIIIRNIIFSIYCPAIIPTNIIRIASIVINIIFEIIII